jgi:hypothetical protein
VGACHQNHQFCGISNCVLMNCIDDCQASSTPISFVKIWFGLIVAGCLETANCIDAAPWG